jgi:hypothetical protein
MELPGSAEILRDKSIGFQNLELDLVVVVVVVVHPQHLGVQGYK